MRFDACGHRLRKKVMRVSLLANKWDEGVTEKGMRVVLRKG